MVSPCSATQSPDPLFARLCCRGSWPCPSWSLAPFASRVPLVPCLSVGFVAPAWWLLIVCIGPHGASIGGWRCGLVCGVIGLWSLVDFLFLGCGLVLAFWGVV
uniref:Uncharacterized protein n=1 Tax=Fagus sylvatica TaxID=28930 RepID=A0A2N9J4U9_FAGSY